MISQTAEYALRAMVHLASDPERLWTVQQVAETTRVPAGYLAKVLQALTREGLLESRRGIGGGFALAGRPDRIRILDVVNAVDPVRRIDRCPLGLEGHGTDLCPLHRRLDAAIAATERAFAETTLSELLADRRGSRPLCDATPARTDARAKRRRN